LITRNTVQLDRDADGRAKAAGEAPRVDGGLLPAPTAVPAIPPLAVTGIVNWPRPRGMLQAIHEHASGRLDEAEFQEAANDAVRPCVQTQLRAGVDLVTDGEQRRDSYASFVGGRLDNCQWIPITDLLPDVDDPAEFEQELRALDVPAGEVRHPAVFGRLRRSRPLAVHELQFARTRAERPIKVALPCPYLLTRTMWLELLNQVVAGAPRERTALPTCRGNWSRNESVAPADDYRALLCELPVGNFFLELCTRRAGELDVLRDLPTDRGIGVGSVNQKLDRVETVDEIVRRAEAAVRLYGADRLLLTPDGGFATLADNPIASGEVAEKKRSTLSPPGRLARRLDGRQKQR
jgi:methionine synthase II (cobalamin-independent)